MKPLSPAAAELTVAGLSLLACGVAVAGAGGAGDDPRAAGLGLAAAALGLWLPWGASATRRAIRLAMPVRPRWSLETAGATVARVLATHTLPLAALAVVAATLGAGHAPWAPAAAAGALVGVGLVALLAAARVRRAERALGRRILRQPRRGSPMGRRSLYLEPQTLADRPGGTTASPWPVHRPPARAPRTAMELEPANGPALHAVGVGVRTLRRPGQPPAGGPPSSGG